MVLILTANEIKPGTLSPTLLANAQETLPLPAGSVSPSILLSLNTPGLQFPLTGFQPQYVCVCVCVEEGLGVMCAMILRAALLLIAAIRPPETVSESSMVNEESTVR